MAHAEEALSLGGRPFTVEERERLYDLCLRGLSFRDIHKDMAGLAKQMGVKAKSSTTIERHHIACKWAIDNADNPNPKTPEDGSRYWQINGRTTMLEEWLEFVKGRKDWFRRRHLDRLCQLAAKIRSMIHDYHPETLPYIQDAPDNNLMIDSDDWSLEPSTWVSLVVPSFDDEKLWGDDFQSFRAHTRSSPFWRDYAKLSEEAKSLEADLDRAAAERAERVAWIADEWKRLCRAGDPWSVEIARTPAFADDAEDERPSVSNGDTKRILGQLLRDGYDFSRRFYSLKRIQQQLRDDLKPDAIERCIYEGECDVCRQGG